MYYDLGFNIGQIIVELILSFSEASTEVDAEEALFAGLSDGLFERFENDI